ncbi:MAG: addiction module protein [Deltaproteobacteria bacterium]|nr:addiction module protein [Deltaproteobacteria bacterium]
MSAKAEKIVAEALALPVPVRAYVAEKLIESLDATPPDGLSPAWKEEVRRRCEEIDRGTAELRDAEAVFAKAFTMLE